MITNKNFKVDLAKFSKKKLMNDFAKEMHFDVRRIGNKSSRDRTPINLLKTPTTIASGISNIIILSSDSDELCNGLKLLLHEKCAGNLSDLNNEEFFAILDKLLENKCLSKNQLKQILIKCNLLHE